MQFLRLRIFMASTSLVWIAATFLAPSIAEARCRSARIALSAPSGDRGATLTITGRFFWEQCHDTEPFLPMEPAKKIQILFVQDNKSQLIATVDADADLKFSVRVTVPANAAPGGATIVAVRDPKITIVADYDLPNPLDFAVTEGRGAQQ